MYETLLPFHSLVRWLLVAGTAYCLIKSCFAVVVKLPYSRLDNAVRGTTSIVSHIQLTLGFILYFKSPLVSYFRSNTSEALHYTDLTFFSIYHVVLMLAAILLITIGAAKAKRASTSYEKHRKTVFWFGIAILLIFLAVPWPFSPYVSRPYLRTLP